jgi:hypothetical protein
MTDSRSLFKFIVNHKKTAKGRLRLDVYAVRRAYRCRGIDNLALIRSEHNAADELSSAARTNVVLRIVMSTITVV